jgi:glycosyltransferase involved in cell wall biosynthesis
MSLRIVIDARHVKDFGIGTYIRNLVHALGRIDEQNQYFLVAGRDSLQEFAGLPENFTTANYEKSDTSVRDQIAFPLFLHQFSADVFHVPHNVVPLIMPRPFVVTVHDLSSILFEQQPGMYKNFLRYQFRRGLQRAAKVIAVSEATRRDITTLFGALAGKIRVVYNAPDPKFLEAIGVCLTSEERDAHLLYRRRLLERYQINYPFLLYAGAIRPQKNIPRLVEAFAVVRGDLEQHPIYKDLHLIIIGDEISKYPAVRRAVIKTRVENVVRFLGFVPLETLRVFYEAACAFIFPSLYEGFGLPPLEALASGVPVVASNVSSLPEVVGDAAILVNPENVFDIARGIREALTDEERKVQLILKGYEQARRFNWEKTARQVFDIYEEVARSR